MENKSDETDKCLRKNTVSYISYNVITATLLIFSNGALIQTFLLSMGVSESKIGYFSSVYNFTQVLTMIFCSLISDRIKNIKKMIALCSLPQIFFYVAMAFFCIYDANTDTVFITALITLFLLGIFLGIINVLIYKLPYIIMDINSYGRVTSIIGIFSGILGVAVSAGVKLLIDSYEYKTVMLLCFVACAVLLIASFAMVMCLKVVNDGEYDGNEPKKAKFYDVFKHKSFIFLSPANIFRGLAAGITAMIPVFAVRQMKADAGMTASMVVVSNVANIVCCFGYMLAMNYIKPNLLCFITSVVTLVPLIGMAFTDSWMAYLILYSIYNIGIFGFSMAVPVYVTKIVPYSIMGSYTSWRMMLTTGGTALGSLLSGVLISKISIAGIMLLAVALQFFSGLIYGLYPRLIKIGKCDS